MCPSLDRGGVSNRSTAARTPSTRNGAPHTIVSEEHGLLKASVDHVSTSDVEPLTAHERSIVGIVAQLRAGVDAAPITALVRDGGEALETVREALGVLGELDPQLLVGVALDALVCAHVDDRGAARQSR